MCPPGNASGPQSRAAGGRHGTCRSACSFPRGHPQRCTESIPAPPPHPSHPRQSAQIGQSNRKVGQVFLRSLWRSGVSSVHGCHCASWPQGVTVEDALGAVWLTLVLWPAGACCLGLSRCPTLSTNNASLKVQSYVPIAAIVPQTRPLCKGDWVWNFQNKPSLLLQPVHTHTHTHPG